MFLKLSKLVLFGNYFVGLLAVALSLETIIQLRLPYNSLSYYLLLFCSTVVYYTYAYSSVLHSHFSGNVRSSWYLQHRYFIKFTQWVLLALCACIAGYLFYEYEHNLNYISLTDWVLLLVTGIAGFFYYGLVGKGSVKLNLRNTGWLKAFIIGFVWSACVTIVPLIDLQLERGFYFASTKLVAGLFIKNWMFCTVNAIIFDLKDYEDDSNKQLKTFVVRFGLNKTIFFVLTPLCMIGIGFIFIFSYCRHFTLLPVLFNLLPFLLLLAVSFSMQQQKSIFFYLVVIDGLVLLKAICGIAAMVLVSN